MDGDDITQSRIRVRVSKHYVLVRKTIILLTEYIGNSADNGILTSL